LAIAGKNIKRLKIAKAAGFAASSIYLLGSTLSFTAKTSISF
jgi:hypothetical protein